MYASERQRFSPSSLFFFLFLFIAFLIGPGVSRAATPVRGAFLDFGPPFGVWSIDGLDHWTAVTGRSPVAIVAGDFDGDGHDDAALDFGEPIGLWLFLNGHSWVPVHPLSPSQLAVGDVDDDGADDLVCVFPGYGVWRWNRGDWMQIHLVDATAVAVGQIDGHAGHDIALAFAGYGVWLWANNSEWRGLRTGDVTRMIVGDFDGDRRDDLLVDVVGEGLSLFRKDSTWYGIHPFSPTHMVTADLDGNGQDDAVIDFGPPYGVLVYTFFGSWEHLNGLPTDGLAVVDRHQDGRADLLGSFGELGVWRYSRDEGWMALNPYAAVRMTAAHRH